MEDYGIIEADFQQFYNLDVARIGFQRYARLLLNLPIEARFIQKYREAKDWDWDKEVNSRILLRLEEIECALANMFRKKGVKPVKPNEQFQPDYVKTAKKHATEHRKEENKQLNEDLKAIFEKRNGLQATEKQDDA